MNTNYFLAVIALLVGALIVYGFCAAGAPALQTAVSGVLCTAFLVVGMALSVEGQPRATLLVKSVALTLFLLLLILNIVLTGLHVGQTLYIIVNGVLTLVAATIVYLIIRAKP